MTFQEKVVKLPKHLPASKKIPQQHQPKSEHPVSALDTLIEAELLTRWHLN